MGILLNLNASCYLKSRSFIFRFKLLTSAIRLDKRLSFKLLIYEVLVLSFHLIQFYWPVDPKQSKPLSVVEKFSNFVSSKWKKVLFCIKTWHILEPLLIEMSCLGFRLIAMSFSSPLYPQSIILPPNVNPWFKAIDDLSHTNPQCLFPKSNASRVLITVFPPLGMKTSIGVLRGRSLISYIRWRGRGYGKRYL